MISVRINKFLAERLGLSRRESDEYIGDGRVLIDGEVARLGQPVTDQSSVVVDGKHVPVAVRYRYIALHKPAGYVCSRRRQGDTPTIYELLPGDMHELKPVGRLDRDSSGILLLTNDGDLAHQMTHPRYHKTKIYEVKLDNALQPLHRQMIADFGVMLEDGKSQFGLERLHDGDDTSWRITMSEGRNRQIRRTFTALGYEVVALHRTQFGAYSLGDIPAGTHQSLDIS